MSKFKDEIKLDVSRMLTHEEVRTIAEKNNNAPLHFCGARQSVVINEFGEVTFCQNCDEEFFKKLVKATAGFYDSSESNKNGMEKLRAVYRSEVNR